MWRMPSCFSILATIWPLEIISGAAAVLLSAAVSTAVCIYLLCVLLSPEFRVVMKSSDRHSIRHGVTRDRDSIDRRAAQHNLDEIGKREHLHYDARIGFGLPLPDRPVFAATARSARSIIMKPRRHLPLRTS